MTACLWAIKFATLRRTGRSFHHKTPKPGKETSTVKHYDWYVMTKFIYVSASLVVQDVSFGMWILIRIVLSHNYLVVYVSICVCRGYFLTVPTDYLLIPFRDKWMRPHVRDSRVKGLHGKLQHRNSWKQWKTGAVDIDKKERKESPLVGRSCTPFTV